MSDQKKNILLIDDDELSLRSLKNALKLNGFEVTAVHNPPLAYQLFHEQEYDIILSDIKMDPWDGLEFLKLVKHNYPKFPVILFSGKMTMDISRKAMHLGVDGLFAKPIPIEDLINLILELTRSNLANSSAIQGLQHKT